MGLRTLYTEYRSQGDADQSGRRREQIGHLPVKRRAQDLRIRRVELGQLLQQCLRRGVAGFLARCLLGVLAVLPLVRRLARPSNSIDR